MKLKRLEITGFKSFMEKTVLDFSEGISAIVGPNGCGKSNVVDALRWVMGEQSAKLLRGKRMDDVIFNGSEDAAPVNIAEVSIIMARGGRDFPGNYAECSEVMITRRLFRDGESEYLINQVPCRLLDVREFFMDTGVGARTYSLVEQNSVANLVEAKPEDRRRFIEEAAGISKYKSRKESAMRKMESTRDNITRLNDILREVKSQLNSITKQARRAERYKALKKDLKEFELTLALQTYTELSGKLTEFQQEITGLRSQETEKRTELKSIEAEIERLKIEVLAKGEKLSAIQEKLYNLKNEIGIREKGVEFSRTKVKDLKDRTERDRAEITGLRQRIEEIGREKTSLLEKMNLAVSERDKLKSSIAVREQENATLRTSERETYQKLEHEKVRYFEVLTESARLKNLVSSLVRSLEDLGRRGEQESREIDENDSRLNTSLAALDGSRRAMENHTSRLQELTGREKELSGNLEALRAGLTEAEGRAAGLREEVNSKSSRLQSLREFQEGYFWCQEGTRSIMTSRDELPVENFLGLVADHIDVPPELETAVEAVLGEKLQYVITKSQEDGIRAIDYLKQKATGRGSFIPLEVRTNGSLSGNIPSEASKILDMVKIEEDFRPIANYLLGDVLLVSDLNSGVGLWRMNGFTGTMVTRDGDIINPYGVLTGGRQNGESGFLEKKRSISELEAQIQELARKSQSAISLKDEIAANIRQAEEELASIRSNLRELELSAQDSRKDIERFENEFNWTRQRAQVLQFNKEARLAEESELRGKIESARVGLDAHEQRGKDLDSGIGGSKSQWEEIRGRLDASEKRLTEDRVLVASLEEKLESHRAAMARLETALRETGHTIESKQVEISSGGRQSDQLLAGISRDEEFLKDAYSEHGNLDHKCAAIREEQKGYEEKKLALENDFLALRRGLDELLSGISRFEMSAHDTSFERESLRKGVQANYYTDLESLAAEFRPLDEAQFAELTAKLEDSRRLIEEFGEVNLLALSEYEEHKQRFDFLSAQIADLNKSLEQLQQTITRINRISRQRFAETFEAVNVCFRETFPKLFPGGKGELRLSDESDLLETGVDIHIQIPGKRTQNITLLSGGEKAMAAVALIFSILLYKPTPFSLLDEVDAALDDSNVNLFNSIVKDISRNSQIVLITHNKRTMEVADNLYGVTMERHGISRLVSVNLKEAVPL